MPRLITLPDGRSLEIDCVSCALTSGLISSTGGVIFESSNFHVHQDIAYPIKGLVIVASKRHFYCMDELTDEEQLEFISLIHKIRSEQRKRLGIDKVYYFYNEDTTHHFHLWMVPRYEWMYEFGNSVESFIIDLNTETKEEVDRIIHRILSNADDPTLTTRYIKGYSKRLLRALYSLVLEDTGVWEDNMMKMKNALLNYCDIDSAFVDYLYACYLDSHVPIVEFLGIADEVYRYFDNALHRMAASGASFD